MSNLPNENQELSSERRIMKNDRIVMRAMVIGGFDPDIIADELMKYVQNTPESDNYDLARHQLATRYVQREVFGSVKKRSPSSKNVTPKDAKALMGNHSQIEI